MPYIAEESRSRLQQGGAAQDAGELNFIITRAIDEYIRRKGGVRYAHINEVVGALGCVKLELYRRIAAPYEDRKRAENGDVHGVLP